MSERKLNQRQELFCQYIFTGMTATDAAIKAGYDPKWAGTNADKQLKNTKIAERIALLNAKIERSAIATVQERQERLTEFLRENNITDKGNLSRQSNITAVVELNKMGGDYPPSKIELEPGEKMTEALAELLGRLRGNKG